MGYDSIATFGGVSFNLSDIKVRTQPSTIKTNVGYALVEKSIPLRNTKDNILSINGVITGLSRTLGQTQATAIDNDRAALEALEDGYKHAYSDGKFSGNYVIKPGTLEFDDSANNDIGQPIKFSMEMVEWQ